MVGLPGSSIKDSFKAMTKMLTSCLQEQKLNKFPEELWTLFNFCCPEPLGDMKEFKERYEYAILRGNDKNAYDREKRIGSIVAKVCRAPCH